MFQFYILSVKTLKYCPLLHLSGQINKVLKIVYIKWYL